MFLLCSTTLGNVTYAQIFPNTPGNPVISQQQQPPSQPKLHLVRITSPHKGQQVPIGKDLIVSGTSANNGTSTCKVSVKVNGIPYHDALPSGPGVQNDYSKWSFTLTPAYTTIKQGQNKIIAKFACTDNPSLLSKTSLNVTGVTGGATANGNSSATAGSGFPSPNASGLSASNNTLASQTTSGSAHHAASDGSGSSAGKIIKESKHSKIIK
jgi:hypothetical protein